MELFVGIVGSLDLEEFLLEIFTIAQKHKKRRVLRSNTTMMTARIASG